MAAYSVMEMATSDFDKPSPSKTLHPKPFSPTLSLPSYSLSASTKTAAASTPLQSSPNS